MNVFCCLPQSTRLFPCTISLAVHILFTINLVYFFIITTTTAYCFISTLESTTQILSTSKGGRCMISRCVSSSKSNWKSKKHFRIDNKTSWGGTILDTAIAGGSRMSSRNRISHLLWTSITILGFIIWGSTDFSVLISVWTLSTLFSTDPQNIPFVPISVHTRCPEFGTDTTFWIQYGPWVRIVWPEFRATADCIRIRSGGSSGSLKGRQRKDLLIQDTKSGEPHSAVPDFPVYTTSI
jgi:hypothetical protein